MRRIITLCLLLASGLTVSAQYNDSVFYNIRLKAGGTLNRTNESRTNILNNNLFFGIKKEKLTLNFDNTYVFGKQNGVLVNKDFLSVLDVNVNANNPRLYYWGLASYENSFSLGVNYRIQSGLGVAYDLVATGDVTINLSDGLLYESSSIKVDSVTDKLFSIVRNSLRLRYKMNLGKNVTMRGEQLLQNSLSDGTDYIFKSTNTLNIRLKKWLSVNGGFIYNKINLTDKENVLITYGILIDNYF